MNVSLSQAKKAVRLFSHEGVDKRTIRHNVTAYLRSMALLGNKHILAIPVQRKGH